MSDKIKSYTISVERTPIVTIDTKGIDGERVFCALHKLLGNKELKLTPPILADMAKHDHLPEVYFCNEKKALAHGKLGNMINIFEEEYVLEPDVVI